VFVAWEKMSCSKSREAAVQTSVHFMHVFIGKWRQLNIVNEINSTHNICSLSGQREYKIMLPQQ
jgi:hypothetical protein